MDFRGIPQIEPASRLLARQKLPLSTENNQLREHERRFPVSAIRLPGGTHFTKTAASLTSAPTTAFGLISGPLQSLQASGHSKPAPANMPAMLTKSLAVNASRRSANQKLAAANPDVVLDHSLGQVSQPVVTMSGSGGKNYQVNAAMGRQVGSNLFFSFESFSLAPRESASFTSANIQNIFARVTSGQPSSIEGLIETTANFFLFNPSGILFGANASLHVSGAFIVSTADYIDLELGGRFSATPGLRDSSLSSGLVSAFGFLHPAPRRIQFQGARLAPLAGLQVISGNISITDGVDVGGNRHKSILETVSGPISFYSASSAGEVRFSLATPGLGYPHSTARAGGRIEMTKSSLIAVQDSNPGPISIAGGAVILDDSTVVSYHSLADILVHARSLSLSDSGSIVTLAQGNARGGRISIAAHDVALGGRGSLIATATEGDGNAGGISILATAQVRLASGAFISSQSDAKGSSGSIAISGQSLVVDGAGATRAQTGIVSSGVNSSGNISIQARGNITVTNGSFVGDTGIGAGKSGDVRINVVGNMTISNQSGISTGTSSGGGGGELALNVGGLLAILSSSEIASVKNSTGKPGSVNIAAGNLLIASLGSTFGTTGITTRSITGATGAGGNLTVRVRDSAWLLAGGTIDAATSSAGRGGTIVFEASNLTIDGTGALLRPTGIETESESNSSRRVAGDAGSIVVSVPGTLSIAGSGTISAATFSAGNGGEINLSAGTLKIDGSTAPEAFTGIGARANAGALGNAGDVAVQVAGDLGIVGGGEITVATFSSGMAGRLSVKAGSMTIRGANGADRPSGVFAEANNGARGGAGALAVEVTRSLSILDGGTITAKTDFGDGGSVRVVAGGNVLLENGTLNASAGANGGNIDLESPTQILLRHSSITATAGNNRSEGGFGGRGGNITLDPEFLILDHSSINANATVGRGGNIQVEAESLFESESTVTATGVRAGVVSIMAPELDVTNGLAPLLGVPLDETASLREECAHHVEEVFSRFIWVGAGGVAPPPDEAASDLSPAQNKH